MSFWATSTAVEPVEEASPPSPPAVVTPPLLLPEYVFTHGVLPFVERSGRENFSLMEVGSWNGLYGLELAARFPRSTLLALEPNRSVWERHTSLAARLRRSHLACLNNGVTEEVAEALAHSNEFLDLQLLIGLPSTKPFDHGVTVNTAKREALDRFVAHLLSMARRSLLLLPGATDQPECRDNRLANWIHGQGGHTDTTPAEHAPADGTVGARLHEAAKTLKLKLRTERLLSGVAADGCPYELWEAGLAYMDRLNRHHFCLGGCKTHTRRSYRLLFAESGSVAATAAATAGWVGRRSDAFGGGVDFLNMSNTQTGRRIPFETGAFNMHSLLSLHAPPPRPTAPDPLREALVLMFLSLPVYQDPAPWNVVWRAGELFPIDVGDGTTYEGRWTTFAQKYIGAVNDCYRMSLRTLCGDDGALHGDERYEACMGRHFGGLCPSRAPFPCLDGCNTSYQHCKQLPPSQLKPGYFASNRHLRAAPERFAQFMPASAADDGAAALPASFGSDDARFGWGGLLAQQRALKDKRARRRERRLNTPPAPPPAPTPAPYGFNAKKKAKPPPPPLAKLEMRQDAALADQTSPADAGGGGLGRGGGGSSGGGGVGAVQGGEAEVQRGLAQLLQARGLESAAGAAAAGGGGSATQGQLPATQQAAVATTTTPATRPPGGMMRALTALQLGMLVWVALQLCDRTVAGRQFLRGIGVMLACSWRRTARSRRVAAAGGSGGGGGGGGGSYDGSYGSGGGGSPQSMKRAAAPQQPIDSRLLGELT